jgi:hypothetical protein
MAKPDRASTHPIARAGRRRIAGRSQKTRELNNIPSELECVDGYLQNLYRVIVSNCSWTFFQFTTCHQWVIYSGRLLWYLR